MTNIINRCDMADCNEEGLHKCYTVEIIEFVNGSKRNYVFQCDDHFFGEMNDPWFVMAGTKRGGIDPAKIVEVSTPPPK